jgi:ATP adenylyltransferase
MNENLWAPWRMNYVTRTGDQQRVGNIFVELPAQYEDEKNGILYRGETAFVILNAFPYSNGHLMVAPFRETNDMTTMTPAELLEVNELIARAVGWLTKVYRPDGFNIGVNLGSAAGAGIPQHIHWHVLPRWNGDTNYMTTIGSIRVMSQSLEDSYAALRAVIDAE